MFDPKFYKSPFPTSKAAKIAAGAAAKAAKAAVNDYNRQSRSGKIGMPFQSGSSLKSGRRKYSAKGKFRMNVTGMSSRKFPRGKKNRVDSFAKYGSVIKIERGDTVSDTDAVYVGVHTAPLQQVAYGVCRALLKQLFMQAGITIVDWSEVVPYPTTTPLCVEIYYYTSKITGTRSVSRLGFGVQTFQAAAESLFNEFSSLNSVSVSTSLIYDKIALRQTTTDASVVYPSLGVVDLNYFKVHIAGFSSLSCQNITVAGNVNGDTAGDEDNADNIENNPLKGKVYYGPGNGFIPLKRSHTDSSFTPFIADAVNGEMENIATDSYPSATAKPPSGNYFKGTKASNVLLQPGQIRNLYVKSYDKYSWSAFWDIFKRYITNIATKDYHPIGKSAMIGLEKQLDSRTTGPSVKLAWELNTTIKVKSVYKKRIESLPILAIEV